MDTKMNNEFKQLLAVIAIIGGVPATAVADFQWDKWYVAPSIIYNDGDKERLVDDGFSGFQFAAGRDIGDWISIEGMFGYSSMDGYYRSGNSGDFTYDSESVFDFAANILLHYDREAEWDPYIMGGLGYLRYDYDFDNGHEARPSGTIGVGLKWHPEWSDRIAFRGEARWRLAYESNYNFSDYVIGLGIQWSFDKATPRQDLPEDTDRDGVLDMWDECPNTAPGVEVNARGCEIQDMTQDSDRDRVPDYRDQCPNTPLGAPVDEQGCSLDSDMDGVLTGQDRCPASRPGADVDEFGCEADDDQDGVLNQRDACPGTRLGARVDINGCEISDVIRLPGVNFGSGSDMLLPGFEDLLRDAAATLNKHPDLKVEVAGHTDDVGDAEMNRGLSERRAKTVRDYLIRYGVNPSRVTFRGYGESEPIANNSTVEGRAENRRVELRISSDE
jgi:OOP family OmpA-OmpF porin